MRYLFLLRANPVWISTLRVLPEARLEILRNVLGGAKGIGRVKLSTPELLLGTRSVRDELGGLGGANALSDGEILGVDFGFRLAVPGVVDGGGRRSGGGRGGGIVELRLGGVVWLVGVGL